MKRKSKLSKEELAQFTKFFELLIEIDQRENIINKPKRKMEKLDLSKSRKGF